MAQVIKQTVLGDRLKEENSPQLLHNKFLHCFCQEWKPEIYMLATCQTRVHRPNVENPWEGS